MLTLTTIFEVDVQRLIFQFEIWKYQIQILVSDIRWNDGKKKYLVLRMTDDLAPFIWKIINHLQFASRQSAGLQSPPFLLWTLGKGQLSRKRTTYFTDNEHHQSIGKIITSKHLFYGILAERPSKLGISK